MIILVLMMFIGIVAYCLVAGADALKTGDERRMEDEEQMEWLNARK